MAPQWAQDITRHMPSTISTSSGTTSTTRTSRNVTPSTCRAAPPTSSCTSASQDRRRRHGERRFSPCLLRVQQEPTDDIRMVAISRAWLVRWATQTQPGNIDNTDIACEHGALLPHVRGRFEGLATMIQEEAWLRLKALYGGGPAISERMVCATCALREQRLRRPQQERGFGPAQSVD